MKDTKQVIVIRKFYTDKNGKQFSLRRGKEIAQCCHAAMSFLTRQIQHQEGWGGGSVRQFKVEIDEAVADWIQNGFRKITCQVDSEQELRDIYTKAKEAGLEVHLIEDSGHTEFHGKTTATCLAIGPDWADKIDEVTSGLRLY